MLSISNFHREALRGKKKKKNSPLYVQWKKSIAKKLQRHPMFELLDILSALREKPLGKQSTVCCWFLKHCQGRLILLGSLMSQEGVNGGWLLICINFSLLAVLLPKHVFISEILCMSPYSVSLSIYSTAAADFYFVHNNIYYYYYYLFIYLQDHPCSIWNFPVQESNGSCTCRPPVTATATQDLRLRPSPQLKATQDP